MPSPHAYVVPTPVGTNKELVYTVFEVIGDPSQEYGELKLASLIPQDGAPLWIIVHPISEGQRISREKCQASSPAVSAGELRHTCDTLPDNSGLNKKDNQEFNSAQSIGGYCAFDFLNDPLREDGKIGWHSQFLEWCDANEP